MLKVVLLSGTGEIWFGQVEIAFQLSNLLYNCTMSQTKHLGGQVEISVPDSRTIFNIKP